MITHRLQQLRVTAVLAGITVAAFAAPVWAEPKAGKPTAEFSAKVTSGYAESWRHYRATSASVPKSQWHTYDREVLKTPTTVRLDACNTFQLGNQLDTYKWSVGSRIQRAIPVAQARPTSCAATFVARTNGDYQVKLEVARGKLSATNGLTVRVDHRLIVSIGDSFSSGEGNPPWVDTRCHRSRQAGVARAAEDLESASSAVTFLSFACSGDEVDAGINGPSNGAVPLADCSTSNCTPLPLRPQIDAAIDVLCGSGPTCASNAPRVDAVFLNIGINDIRFSNVLQACAIPSTTQCNQNAKVDGDLNDGRTQIVKGLARLAPRFATKPFLAARVFVVLYPDDPFDGGGGCKAMQDVTEDEGRFLRTQAMLLNRVLLYQAAINDWIPVPVASRFQDHGYCSSSPWLRGLASSFVTQGSKDGTMHPNPQGHGATAEEVVKAFRAPFVRRVRVGRVTVKFESVTIVDKRAQQSNGLAPDHTTAAFGFETSSQQYGFPVSGAPLILFPDHPVSIAMGEPTPLPPSARQTVEVYNKNPLVIHVYTTALPLSVTTAAPPTTTTTPGQPDPVDPDPRVLQLTVKHDATDHYGASSDSSVGSGEHTARRETAEGTIEVRYVVTFEPLQASSN